MPTLTADDWQRAAARRLGQGGVDAVRVEVIAKDLKVSKGSFYWHFENRAALLTGVLRAWESLGTEGIIAEIESSVADPRDRATALVKEVFSHPDHDGFEVGVRAWARTDPAARAVVARVDERRIHYVAQLARNAGVAEQESLPRAAVLYRALLGEFLMRSYGAAALGDDALANLTNSLVEGSR